MVHAASVGQCPSAGNNVFTQYNGLYKDDAYFLLDFDYVRRDPETGTWTVVRGKDLGLDTREVSFLYGPQGRYKLFGEYWELTRYYPRTINTGVQGIGTTSPTLWPARI